MPSTGLERKEVSRFLRTWENLGCNGDPFSVYSDLISRYREPHRHYHTFNHIISGLNDLEKSWGYAQYPNEIAFAFYFHDAIYDLSPSGESENEIRSAELARDIAIRAGLFDDVVARIEGLVLVTDHKKELETYDEGLMADMDLAILGKPPEEYQFYERGIWEEYQQVTDLSTYQKGRRRVLEHFLRRSSNCSAIYNTPYFYYNFETQATLNLTQAIRNLDVISSS